MDRSFFRFVTIHACDRRTDRILIAIPRLHSMQRGKNYCKLHAAATQRQISKYHYGNGVVTMSSCEVTL